ncbi:helix-turn-helix transcriptional regulator [Kitasatospora sp. NPDC008115]|uniref:helix-turn-helix domain-containing protein n=1 Tax=Kitasatospora sp. NPDC008115 TaxID=3364022 RepID=UPI0036EF3D95
MTTADNTAGNTADHGTDHGGTDHSAAHHGGAHHGGGDGAALRAPGKEAATGVAHRTGLLLLAGCTHTALAAHGDPPHPHPPGQELRPAASTVVVAAGLAGWFDRALAAVERPAAAAQPWFAEIRYAHCIALLMAGRVHQAWRIAEDGHRQERAAHDTPAADGWLALRDLATAIAELESASRLFDGGTTCPMLAPCLAQLAAAGEADRAPRTPRPAERSPQSRLFLPWLTLSQAWTTAAAGNTTHAARQALAAADIAMALGQYAVEATASYDVARLGNPNAVRHRLAALADLVHGPVVPAMADAAGALARSDPRALDTATATFTRLNMDLLAAETATAAAALRHTATPPTTVACPNATTPLLRLTAPLVELTRRERDVTLLAAKGYTSPAIGHRLGLSARTVDNYLGRAYQKLGVTSRRELAPLVAGDRPRPPIHAEGTHR